MKIPPQIMAIYNDLTEEQIKHELGKQHEQLTRTQERMKNDPVTRKLKDQIRDHEDKHYKGPLRLLRLHLAALREVAKLKGVKYD